MRNLSTNEMFPTYSGGLADVCASFVGEKRALGYSYLGTANKLSSFCRFTLNYEFPKNTLTEEVVRAWITRKPNDADRHVQDRRFLVRQLAEYMVRTGYTAYIFPAEEMGKCRKTFEPYIFTHSEITDFFKAVDGLKYNKHSCAPRRHIIMPVIFRLLYCCGLRESEALNLQGGDVDLVHGVLTIRDSKFEKSRYVPVSEELREVLKNYSATRLVGPESYDWFFAAPDGGRYHERTVYGIFRLLLREAGISHGGRGNGPRLHDFRHTFAVHCLQKWVNQGTELTNALPRLTVYLGHEGFASAEQYLRMTAEVYPEITALMEKEYGYIIPTWEGSV